MTALLSRCPSWCDPAVHEKPLSGDPIHRSATRVWENAEPDDVYDHLAVQVSFRRGDEINHGGYCVGDCDMTVRFSAHGGALSVDEDGRVVLEVAMTPNRMRECAGWLTAQADAVDPYHTNGEPTGLL